MKQTVKKEEFNSKFYEQMTTLAPGTVIIENNIIWIRMRDDISCHLETMFFCADTGAWKHVSYFEPKNVDF